MKTVLVTGGAGYIGSHAAMALMTEGYRVVVLDDLSTGNRMMVPQGTAAFVRGSVANGPLVRSLIRLHSIKSVLHFAAFVDVAESQREPEKYYENNYRNTESLIKAAQSAGVERFIFSSTAAVYGNPSQVPTPESAPLSPVSIYGRSKMLAEKVVSESGMEYAILRYFNVAGADWKKGLGYMVNKDPTHLIRRVVLAMLGDIEHIDVFGTDYPTHDGTAVRDYIHVRDLAHAHVDILRYLERSGVSDIYNVGYGRGYSVLEVVQAAEKILGKSITQLNCHRRPGDPMMIVASNRKLAETIKWQPEFMSLGGMIHDELDWVKSQRAHQE